MVKHSNLPEEQRGEYDSKNLHNLASPLILDSDCIERIWLRVQNIPYIFDDFTRGQKKLFFDKFFLMNTLAYAIDDYGIIYFTDVCPPLNAVAHVIFWDRKFTDRTAIFRELCKHVLDIYGIHRLSSIIPTFNRAAILFAKRAGFRLEGVHREIVLSLGKWHDAAILSLLRRDFNGSEHRGNVSATTDQSILVGGPSESAIPDESR